jgi:dTDP-4-dehydrorhamnose reductase
MILLFGSAGYIGGKFRTWLEANRIPHVCVNRKDVDLNRPGSLRSLIKRKAVQFLINCAGYTGKPNVDSCEDHKEECLFGNAILPGLIARECREAGIDWGHVSSGCIFTGNNGGKGFRETDRPNFDFRHDNCSWYSGTKALGEEILATETSCYIWRIRIPFEEENNPRNYLGKLCRYPRLLDAENSLTHLGEFVREVLDMVQRKVPKGVYNMTQPGSITTREIVNLMATAGILRHQPVFYQNEEEFMRQAARTPRSNCVLSVEKAIGAGCRLTSIRDKLREVCGQWKP